MKKYLVLLLLLACDVIAMAQHPPTWTAADRKLLIDNLTRTRDEIVMETQHLSPAQWNFRESPDRWSIGQVVEHIAIWELLLEREINQALGWGPHPEYYDAKRSDSSVVAFLMEEKAHVSEEYTRPFTFTVPLGNNPGEANLKWLLHLRNEAIGYLDTTTANLRVFYQRPGRGQAHQVFITIYGHADRHLRQIRRVKKHPGFPKQ